MAAKGDGGQQHSREGTIGRIQLQAQILSIPIILTFATVMGKKSRKLQNQGASSSSPSHGDKKSSGNHTEELMSRGDAAMESLEPLLASQFYTRALDELKSSLSPGASQAALAHPYERLGEAMISLDDSEGAKKAFEASLAAEATARRHLFVAQLCSHSESLSHFKQGIALLNAAKDSDKPTLVQAYCGIVELYTTDLCMEEGAEEAAEAAAASAAEFDDGTLPDAKQTMANLRLSQGRADEAAAAMLEVWMRIGKGCKAMAEQVGLGEMGVIEDDVETGEGGSGARGIVEVSEDNLKAVNSLPDYEFRTTTAKLMMESASLVSVSDLESSGSLLDGAIQVLGSLLSENDEVIETWFLLGKSYIHHTHASFQALSVA